MKGWAAASWASLMRTGMDGAIGMFGLLMYVGTPKPLTKCLTPLSRFGGVGDGAGIERVAGEGRSAARGTDGETGEDSPRLNQTGHRGWTGSWEG